MKLYCNRYTHFKHPLVCAVNCQYRKRCADFALHYEENREAVNTMVLDYYTKNGKPTRQLSLYGTDTQPATLRELYTLEVKRNMADTFIWIDAEDKAEVLTMDDLMSRAEQGDKPKYIFKVAQEMELRFQLVPRKRIEESQRKVAADAERTAARKSKTPAAEKVAAVG